MRDSIQSNRASYQFPFCTEQGLFLDACLKPAKSARPFPSPRRLPGEGVMLPPWGEGSPPIASGRGEAPEQLGHPGPIVSELATCTLGGSFCKGRESLTKPKKKKNILVFFFFKILNIARVYQNVDVIFYNFVVLKLVLFFSFFLFFF